jgi:prolyl-tRNA synthetase
MEAAQRIKANLLSWEQREPNRLRVHVDAREGIKPGAKYFEWELRGVPIRMELGPRDLDKSQAVLVRRDTREKRPVSLETLGEDIAELLETIQDSMLVTARDRREANSLRGEITYDRFREVMAGDGAFVYAGWCSDASCEAMMQDNKALQAGTSHNLGQNFAKAFDLTFQSEQGTIEHAWNTSWGVSTRLVGGLVMTHGDDVGLRTPPLLAPTELVIVPIFRTDEERSIVLEAANRIARDLGAWERRDPNALRVKVDARDGMKPGAKYYDWEMRGVPLRLELGPRDLQSQQGVLVRRDTREKQPTPLATLGEEVEDLLERIQNDMLAAARERRETNSVRGHISYDRFREIMDGDGAFVYAGWCGGKACESEIKDETKATIRCLPDEEFRSAEAPSRCLKCGATATAEALWAKAY